MPKNTSSKSDKKKPVILQVLPELNAGGVERGTIELAKALQISDFTPLVASAGGNMVKQLTSAHVEHITLPLASKNPFTIWKNGKRLAKVIKEKNVDIIHARSRAPAWSCYFAAKKTGCKFITTFHGVYSRGSELKNDYNSIMTKGAHVIAISEFIEKHIKKYYGVKANNITVIHRGADLAQFDRKLVPERRILQMDKALRIEHDKPIILLPGRITRWKGHEFLIDALSKIDKYSFRCLIVGDLNKHPKYVQQLDKKIENAGLSSIVRIVHNVTDMPALYSLVDIVVSASLRPEAFGRISIEAQAMERMTVATNHGGSCETIIDGKTGWLVEPGDADGLAKILEKLLKISPRRRKTITSAAKEHVKNNFSLESMTKATIELYKKLLKIK